MNINYMKRNVAAVDSPLLLSKQYAFDVGKDAECFWLLYDSRILHRHTGCALRACFTSEHVREHRLAEYTSVSCSCKIFIVLAFY